MSASKPHSGQEIVNILKAGMPWPEPSDGGWHWAMPPVRSMEKARKVLGEVQGLVEQLESIRGAAAVVVREFADDNPFVGYSIEALEYALYPERYTSNPVRES